VNPYQRKHRSQIFTRQADKVINRLTATLGDKKTRHEMIGDLIATLRRYFTNLGKPIMQVRPVQGPPLSKPFNDTMSEIEDDISVLYSETATLEESLLADFNYSETERQRLSNQIVHVNEKLKNFEMYAANQGFLGQTGTDVLFARESFRDLSRIDKVNTSGQLADIDTANGLVTLAVSGKKNRAVDAKVFPVIGQPFEWSYGLIGSESNGLPGNTHEVVPTSMTEQAQGEELAYTFVGEHDAHCNIATIGDENPDTWFEFEAVNVPQEAKNKAKGYGFAFQLGPDDRLNWAFDPKDGVLQLCVRYILPEPRLINWIAYRPYVPPNEGAMPARIDSITVSQDDTAPTIKLKPTVTEDALGTQCFTFDQILAKQIDIRLKQNVRYDTLIGHFYYERTTVTKTTKKKLFGLVKKSKTATSVTRVDGPDVPIEVTGIVKQEEPSGMAQVGATIVGIGSLGYAAATIGTTLGASTLAAAAPIALAAVAVGTVFMALFGSTKTEVLKDEVQRKLEAFDGWRYCIGIKDIDVLSKTYYQTSELVSQPWHSGAPIRRISLQSHEVIPATFDASRQKDKWISYYISIDDGVTWHPIQPEDQVGSEVPEIYVINSTEVPETRERVGYLEHDGNVYDVRVKVVLRRPTDIPDAESYTPVLTSYTIKLQVEEEPQ
jgi:hypothetical protein